MKRKKITKQEELSEPVVSYNRITVTSFQESYEQMLLHTLNMSSEERMAYLQKLREITHGSDMTEEVKIFHQSKIKINQFHENT